MYVCSLPNYAWPKSCTSVRSLPRRLAGAIVFHVCRLLGIVASRLAGRRRAVLVVRTDGIGDAILFEPALRSLAARFPDHELHLWAPPATCELFAVHPYVSAALPILRGAKAGNLAYFSSLASHAVMGYRLGRHVFDVAIYPAESPEPFGSWILASVRAAERWLNPGDTQNQFDWQRQAAVASATRLLAPAGEGHELARNAALAAQWDQPIDGDPVRVYPAPVDVAAARYQLDRWRQAAADASASALIGVVPASSMSVKGYPPSHWVQLITRLWREQGALCALIGGPADQAVLDELGFLLEDVPLLKMHEPLGVGGLAALIKGLDALISVDTAAGHLAVSQDTPSVVLASGGHPGRFFPWPAAPHSITLTHAMPCAGCHCRCKLEQAECLTRITPDQIIEGMAKVLKPAAPMPLQPAAELRRAV